jgi:hypothetical protein
VGAVWKCPWSHAEKRTASANSSMQVTPKKPREEVILRPSSILGNKIVFFGKKCAFLMKKRLILSYIL